MLPLFKENSKLLDAASYIASLIDTGQLQYGCTRDELNSLISRKIQSYNVLMKDLESLSKVLTKFASPIENMEEFKDMPLSRGLEYFDRTPVRDVANYVSKRCKQVYDLISNYNGVGYDHQVAKSIDFSMTLSLSKGYIENIDEVDLNDPITKKFVDRIVFLSTLYMNRQAKNFEVRYVEKRLKEDSPERFLNMYKSELNSSLGAKLEKVMDFLTFLYVQDSEINTSDPVIIQMANIYFDHWTNTVFPRVKDSRFTSFKSSQILERINEILVLPNVPEQGQYFAFRTMIIALFKATIRLIKPQRDNQIYLVMNRLMKKLPQFEKKIFYNFSLDCKSKLIKMHRPTKLISALPEEERLRLSPLFPSEEVEVKYYRECANLYNSHDVLCFCRLLEVKKAILSKFLTKYSWNFYNYLELRYATYSKELRAIGYDTKRLAKATYREAVQSIPSKNNFYNEVEYNLIKKNLCSELRLGQLQAKLTSARDNNLVEELYSQWFATATETLQYTGSLDQYIRIVSEVVG